ncbi:acetoacetate decarboxylase family protein [Dactylosporangium sp. AC04546]|uniref:acetoacetate decarboxylase family protein n=1 Tax=Dactylosporangium sp. AC04546 TaxID=2862460 RepID=UPI001EDFAE5E|nr:acetoacetate decarboxylase family protein [Dactylosporangium sp. AC04546]WVK80674.1 acetoacetate decarboxylase family protein [Dactylosporangium sp. AC04546]
MKPRTTSIPSIPLHSPFYATDNAYEGDCLGLSVLLELPEDAVRAVLAPTPFDFVTSHAWVEFYTFPTLTGFSPYNDTFGDQYAVFGVVVPASYGGVHGGYYAHCYKNKDFSASMGREMAGFPVKAAEVHVQKTGRAMTGRVACPTARYEASVIVGDESVADPAFAVRNPTLLLHVIADVEAPDSVLLEQVISRDVSQSSDLTAVEAEPAVNYRPAPSEIDDLSWLEAGRPVHADFFSGRFRGALGRVLATTEVSPRLLDRVAAIKA